MPHPLGGIPPSAVDGLATPAMPEVERLLTATNGEGATSEGAAPAVLPARGEPAERLALPSEPRALHEAVIARGWSDGLPIIPPTPALVEALIECGDRDALDVLGVLPPGHGLVTVEGVAANAAMAGCEPRVFPVVLAAVQAILEEAHNVAGLNATTHPVAETIVVSGPIASELGIHSGSGCFGPTFPANASIGRAIRLVLLNIGGAQPGRGDSATQGTPAKFASCFAENAEANPWAPFHVARGLESEASAVTVFGSEGPHNIRDGDSNTGEGLLRTIAGAMSQPGSNNILNRGQPLLALCPEHAALLAGDGWTRERIQAWLFEHARYPAGRLSPEMRRAIAVRTVPEGEVPEAAQERYDDDVMLPIAEGPEGIQIVVAGGAGKHSAWFPSWGRLSRAVTVPIAARR